MRRIEPLIPEMPPEPMVIGQKYEPGPISEWLDLAVTLPEMNASAVDEFKQAWNALGTAAAIAKGPIVLEPGMKWEAVAEEMPPVVKTPVSQASFIWVPYASAVSYQECYRNGPNKQPVGWITWDGSRNEYHALYVDEHRTLGVWRGSVHNAREWVRQMVAKHYVATQRI